MKKMNLLNILRLRLFNIKLFGDIRLGLYKEFSPQQITEFIADFYNFCKCRESKTESLEIVSNLPQNSNFEILKRLCEQYYVYENTDKFKTKILQEVNEIITELRTDAQAQKDLEFWLNANKNNVIAKLREEHPELKEDDIKLYCYIQAEFSPTMMSVLLRKDKSVVYNRVSRLKAKIK